MNSIWDFIGRRALTTSAQNHHMCRTITKRPLSLRGEGVGTISHVKLVRLCNPVIWWFNLDNFRFFIDFFGMVNSNIWRKWYVVVEVSKVNGSKNCQKILRYLKTPPNRMGSKHARFTWTPEYRFLYIKNLQKMSSLNRISHKTLKYINHQHNNAEISYIFKILKI